MHEFFRWLFSPEGFMPHGHCYLWTPGILRLHVLSDALIALSYYSIPITLAWFVRKRRDVDFRAIFVCFAVFILACGTTHLLEIWNVWHASYWLSGGMKAVTAAASLPTAYLLTRLLPRALALPSPSALQRVNESLHEEIAARRVAEERLQEANALLEQRVAERTAELVRQISERERSDLTAARLAAIVEPSSDSIVSKDLHSVVMSWNAGAERMFGYTAGEMVGQSITRIIPPERLGEEEMILARIARGESVEPFETQRVRKDGTLIEVSVTVSPVKDAAGHVVGASKMARDITAQKGGEEARRASELRYRRLFETSNDGILILDAETGMVVDLNPFLISILGFSHEQFLGKAIWELGFFKDIVANEHNFAELREKEYLRYENLPLETFDGHRIEVEFISNVYLVNDTKVIQCNIRDLTARRTAEQALRESEARMRLATEASAVGIWEWNVISDQIRWDEQMFRIHGLAPTPDGFIPYAVWSGAVLPEDLPEQERILRESVHRLGHSAREFRIRRATDGECRHIQAVETVRTNAAGEAEWVVGTNLDVTDRKRAEEALRDSEEQFRTMVDAISQLAWMAHPDGFIHWYNQRWFDYTGTTPEQMEGWGWQRVHDPEMLPKVLEGWKASIATGEPFEMNFPLRGADGTYRWFLTRAFPVKDAAGRVLRWCGTNTDISRMRDAEEEIHQLNAELERRVTERTAQLEAANKELEAFSYSVSHDLRAPLRAVDGFSQALLEDYAAQLPEEGRRYLGTIRQGAQKMGALIDDLLAFSRLSRLPLKKRQVDTARLVHESIEELAPQRAGRQIEIRIGDLPACHGDPALLKQVWINLLSNAFKYTGKREAAVVEIGCIGERGAREFFVRDNGTGFDMRYAGKLFGVFQRLHRAEDYEGTGVGLAIVQRVIHRHGGAIRVDAELDRGATFYFTLAVDNPV